MLAYAVYSGLGGFANVAEFDAYLSSQQDNTTTFAAEFQAAFDCPGYDDTLQYHMATLCGMYVDISTQDYGCNAAGGVADNTCTASAVLFLDSAAAVFANASVCNQAPATDALAARNQFLTQVTTFIDSVGDAATCVVADAASVEYYNCGFHQTNLAVAYCQSNADNGCCSLVAAAVTTAGGAGGSATASASASASSAATASSVAATNSGTSSGATTNSSGPTESSTATDTSSSASSSSSSSSSSSPAAAADAASTILGLPRTEFIAIVAGGGGAVVLVAVIVAVMCARRAAQKRPGGGTNVRGGEGGEALLAGAGYAGGDQGDGGGAGGRGGRRDVVSGRSSAASNVFRSSPAPRLPALAMPSPSMSVVTPEMSSQALAALGGAGSAETMEVIFNYVPNLTDEIYLYAGDKVLVRHKFDDGWGFGANLTTRMEGSFPLACVGPLAATEGAAEATGKFDGAAGRALDFAKRASSIQGAEDLLRRSGYRSTMYTDATSLAATEEEGRSTVGRRT
ncbi:hypothetical protein HK405_006513 [Cladochytrium tenue]|nr:hypothetical protein HK405_006513 [Cladochytrium tenue]